MWNLNGFYVVDRLPNDTKMNSAYFLTNLLVPLEEAIFPRGRPPHRKRLMIRVTNCSVHTSRTSTDWLQEHNIVRMPRQSCSSDPLPRDFHLFPIVKEKLERIQLADEDQFFGCFERSGSTRIECRMSGLGAVSSRSE
jgi:hypothetical protein